MIKTIEFPMSLEDLEKLAIQTTLEITGGNKMKAARHLRVSRSAFYEKCKRLGIVNQETVNQETVNQETTVS